MEFKNAFHIFVLCFAFLNVSHAEVQLPRDVTAGRKQHGFKNYIDGNFKPVLQEVLDVSASVHETFVKNMKEKNLQLIHEDRETGTAEDASSDGRSTPLGHKDVNKHEVSTLDDPTHSRDLRPPPQNSRTETLPNEVRGVRTRREMRPLSSWIQNVHIYGVPFRYSGDYKYVERIAIIRATAAANNIHVYTLRQNVQVMSIDIRRRTAILDPKSGSIYSGSVMVYWH